MGVERGRVRDVIDPAPSTTLRAIVIVVNDRGPRPDISPSPSASNDGMHLPRLRRMAFSSACEPQREREPSRFEGPPKLPRASASLSLPHIVLEAPTRTPDSVSVKVAHAQATAHPRGGLGVGLGGTRDREATPCARRSSPRARSGPGRCHHLAAVSPAPCQKTARWLDGQGASPRWAPRVRCSDCSASARVGSFIVCMYTLLWYLCWSQGWYWDLVAQGPHARASVRARATRGGGEGAGADGASGRLAGSWG